MFTVGVLRVMVHRAAYIKFIFACTSDYILIMAFLRYPMSTIWANSNLFNLNLFDYLFSLFIKKFFAAFILFIFLLALNTSINLAFYICTGSGVMINLIFFKTELVFTACTGDFDENFLNASQIQFF